MSTMDTCGATDRHHRTLFPRLQVVATAAVLAVAGGCTHVNRPLNGGDVQLERRAHNRTRAAAFVEIATPPKVASNQADDTVAQPRPADPESRMADVAAGDRNGDGYFVGLAISGGGSRSANFAAACMFQLQRIGLLQRVDYVSSVSGGSLTAAYYCAADDDAWNPAEVQKRLTHHFATDLIVQTLLPWNVVGMLVTHLDRSDLLANTFRDHLFTRDGKHLTYADLRPDRPRLLVNATDLQSGRRFVFTNESFDQLNSDLSAYPLAYAVAASGSVPVLLHQVTLRDFSTTFKQYRHLIDGGVTDNLGVLSLVEVYNAQRDAARAAGVPDPYPRGAVFIVLDARTQYDARLSAMGDTGLIETLASSLGLTSTVLLNRASSATLSDLVVKNAPDGSTAEQLRQNIAELEGAGYIELRDKGDQPVRVVHLALSSVNDLKNLPFASFRERVSTVGTYFNIDPTEAYHLYQAADLLVQEKFERQLRELNDEMDER